MEAKEFNYLLKSMNSNQSSVERLYCFYYPRIVRHISIKFGEDIASDVAQEFFIKLMRIGDEQDYIKYPTSWVYTCAENIAKRKVVYENRYTELSETKVEPIVQSERELHQDLKDILKNLDPLSQEIIRLYYWEGYNQEEIATMLKLTSSNVRKKHSRAIKKLKNILE